MMARAQKRPTAKCALIRALVRHTGGITRLLSILTSIRSLLHSTNVADNAIDGGLICSGSGTLALAGTNTYTGPTLVGGGTLALANNGSINANVDVTQGTLDVSGIAGAVTIDKSLVARRSFLRTSEKSRSGKSLARL